MMSPPCYILCCSNCSTNVKVAILNICAKTNKVAILNICTKTNKVAILNICTNSLHSDVVLPYAEHVSLRTFSDLKQ